jgi:hypothetical protein
VFRVYAASRVLALGRDQIPTVALHCGFDSERTFLRAFTRIIGVSPSQFRDAARGRLTSGQLVGPLDPHDIDVNELLARAVANAAPRHAASNVKGVPAS